MFTIYNPDNDTYQLVEEPDPSLSYTEGIKIKVDDIFINGLLAE